MSDFETLIVDFYDNALTITLNRPDRHNALTDTMAHELTAALNQTEHHKDPRRLIITGVGKSFCVGQDLAKFHLSGI